MFLQEIILAIIILAYAAFAVALFHRIGAAVSARWSSHKPPERQQTGAKILPFPTAKPSQDSLKSGDHRRASVLRKKAESIKAATQL
jgi:hypothetical protein